MTDHSQALQAASDACHSAPERPEPHYAYGEVWLARGNPALAEQAFAMALQLAPNWADAWINFGIARYRQGAIEDAAQAMRQALRLAPGHPTATANMGAFLRLIGAANGAGIRRSQKRTWRSSTPITVPSPRWVSPASARPARS